MGCSHLASALLLTGLLLLFSSVVQFKTVERQVMSVHITTYLYRCLIGLLVALVADPTGTASWYSLLQPSTA